MAVEPASAAGTPFRRRRPLTLRRTMISISVLLVLLVCGVVGIATEVYLRSYLTRQVDERLQASAGMNAADGPGRGEGAGNGPNPSGPPGGRGGPFTDQARCETRAGTTDTATAGAPRPGFTESLSAAVTDGVVTYAGVFTSQDTCEPIGPEASSVLLTVDPLDEATTVHLTGFGDYRVLGRSAIAPGGATVTQISGLPLDRVQQTMSQLRRTLIVVMGCALVVAAAAAFVIVRRALRPLERVAATARQVSTVPLHTGEVDLGIRVSDRDIDPRTEVGSVGAALNQLLGHVATALDRRHASEMQVRQFVADASHELRTPLAAIRGYTELARHTGADSATVRHALSRVESESVRMSGLVDDLLLLARLDAGRPLARDEVDLSRLVVDVVSDARVSGPEHRWRLELPDEPVTVLGDEPRLHQVLANLLANARVHTPPGTTVTTAISTSGAGVSVSVSDDGPGIDPSLLDGIFDRFVRGDSARTRQNGSTGLGLAIVRAVVTAHGGTVTATSGPGRTAFDVRLPRSLE